MQHRWKLIAIATPLTLTAFALGSYAYTRAHAAPTYRLANGVEVTPTIKPLDETAKLLEVRSWDFDIMQPDASQPLYVSFALYGNRKFIKTINGGSGLFPDAASRTKHGSARTHVTFSCLPLGDSEFDAKELKYVLTLAGSNISGKMPNPILKGNSLASQMQVVPADNVILLLSTSHTKSYTSGNMTDNDTNLALCITKAPPR